MAPAHARDPEKVRRTGAGKWQMLQPEIISAMSRI
jgi:hypothetical protein